MNYVAKGSFALGENKVFHLRTEMPNVAFSSLLCENKKHSCDKMIPLVGIKSGPSDSMVDLEA